MSVVMSSLGRDFSRSGSTFKTVKKEIDAVDGGRVVELDDDLVGHVIHGLMEPRGAGPARGIDILTPVGHGLGEEAGHDDRFAEGDVAAAIITQTLENTQ